VLSSAYELPTSLESRRAQLGAAATGRELIQEFFILARIAIGGYLPPDSKDDVVRVEADSGPEFHAITLKRQLTWFGAENDPGFAHFYFDMSFQRHSEDQPLNWFTINYGEGPVVDQDVDLDAVAQALQEHDELQRILARVPQTARTWVDGEPREGFYDGPGKP
jgi:hypothetical protein